MNVRLRAAGILITMIVATRAEAIPAFARKYGMSCSACHVSFPVLNQQGLTFRDAGYQLGLMKDDPSATAAAYVPFSARTVPSYKFERKTNQPSDLGKVETRTGGIPVPGVDLITAGTFAPDLSFLAVLAGFTPDEAGFVESAWARIANIGGSGWLNVRFGKFEPEQPVSERRNLFRTAGHAVYSAKIDGSAASFDLASNHVGVEVDGHDARSLTRYSVALLRANEEPGGRGVWSSPVVYAHATRAVELDSSVLPWVRIGALGAMGWWPTHFAMSADGTAIPGTGRDHATYSRVGAELSGILGDPATPFLWTVAAIHGEDSASSPGTDPALATAKGSFDGGFVEVNWVPFAAVAYNATPWAIFARYDQVRYDSGPGDFDGLSVGVRRHMALGPRASLALHAEVHADRTKGTGFEPGSDVESQKALLGFDICF